MVRLHAHDHGTGGVHGMTSQLAGVSLAIGKGFSVRNFWRDVNVPEVVEFFNSSEGMLSLFVPHRGDYTAKCVGHHGALLDAPRFRTCASGP